VEFLVPGLLLAVCTAHAIPALLFKDDAERLVFAPHLLPTLSASVVCVCITIMCGMLPVVATVTDRPWIVLGRESGLPSKSIQRLRAGFIIGQIGACYVLVISSVFLMEGLDSALETSVGSNLRDPILLTVQAQMHPEVDVKYFNAVEERAKSIANLTPLAWTTRLPGNQPTWRSFRVQPSPSKFRDIDLDIVRLTQANAKLDQISGDPAPREGVVPDIRLEVWSRSIKGAQWSSVAMG
jgi:hypothetical protein